MKDKQTLRSRATPRWPQLVGLTALSLTFLAPAMAHDTHHNSGHHGERHVTLRQHHARQGNHFYDRYHRRSHGHARGQREFVVPVRLSPQALATYRDYHYGRIYYRPHRHHHAVYNFPVYTNAGWAYRSHYYCNGALYAGHVPYNHRHVRLSFRF